MKTVLKAMKIAAWCCAGGFAAAAGYNVVDYLLFPEKYALNSAPWYTVTEICGIFTAISLALLLTGIYFIRRHTK